jgi:fatty-acyl-CoA synthase
MPAEDLSTALSERPGLEPTSSSCPSVPASHPDDQATDWVDYNARRFPRRPAPETIGTATVLTWSELEQRVSRLAGALRDRYRVRPGDRVALLADNDNRLLELQFACMRVGALFVPLNWRLSLPELQDCCADADPTLMVHDRAWRDAGAHLGTLAQSVASWECEDGHGDLDQAIAAAVPFNAGPDNRLSDPVQILYTSGTTGEPKGALVTRSGLTWHSLNVADLCEVWGRGERLLTAMPLFHGGGLNGLALPVLRAGGTVTVTRRFEPARMVELLADAQRGFTHFAGVPAMYQAMAASGLPDRFPPGIHAQVGGGYLPSELVATFGERGLALSSGYGSTEMGPIVSVMPGPEAARRPGSCGYPARHTAMRIVDDNGNDVPAGDSGELWVRGPAITPGYWGREPGDGFVDGWFRSGDAVRRDGDGYLHLCGRYKDMYKSGGENVFAAEVENVLAEHPDVAEVAVIGVPDPRWGEVGRAVIVVRPGTTVDLPALELHCRDRLARYKTPRSVVLVDALPRNVTGKVVKSDIHARYGSEQQ